MAMRRTSIRPSGALSAALAAAAGVGVARAVFTNASPATAPASSGRKGGLSNLAVQICLPAAQSNQRKKLENSGPPIETTVAMGGELSSVATRAGPSTGWISLVVLSVVAFGIAPAAAQSRPWLDPRLLPASKAGGS